MRRDGARLLTLLGRLLLDLNLLELLNRVQDTLFLAELAEVAQARLPLV